MNPKAIPTRKRKVQCIEDGHERCLRTEDGAEFHIDQGSLSRSSKYFNNLFLYDSSPDILIRGISGKTMRLIVNFLLKRTVMLNSDNVIPLLEAADYFVLDEFSRKILCAIPDLICKENIIHLYNAALNFNHLTLHEVIHSYVLAHFHMVAVQSDIGELCFEQFDKLLSNPNLIVRDEEMVWDAIVKWVQADEELRREAVPLLLRHIRPELCSRSFVESFFQHPLLQDNEFCANITACNRLRSREYRLLRRRFITCIEGLTSMQLNSDRRVPSMEFRVICCTTDKGNEIKIAIGPVNDQTKETIIAKKLGTVPKFVFLHCSKICIFDPERHIDFELVRKTWIKRPPPSENLHPFSFCKPSPLKSKFFAISVEYNPTAHAVASFYNFRSMTWKRLSSCCLTPDAEIKIKSLESVGLDDLIYVAAMGAINGILKSLAKVFDPEKNTWSSAFHLTNDYALSHHFTMESLDGALYFIASHSIRFQKFDPKNESWSLCQILPFTYNNPRLEVIQGQIILYETEGDRRPIKWVEEQRGWMWFSDEIHFLLEPRDEDVSWRCYCEFRRREWKKSANEWKSLN